MRVYKEILEKEHENEPLAKWVKIRKKTNLFVDPANHKNVQEKCGEINNDVVQQYSARPAKVAEFLSGADTWLISHAVCEQGIVVSHESRVDRFSTIPKIPNVCTRFGVECINLREMLMRLAFRFK